MEAPDDLDVYFATLSEDERTEIGIAGATIDLAILLYRAREGRGLTQTAAAAKAGLAQQAVSRFERPPANVRFDTLCRYLGSLGYQIELTVKDPDSGRIAASLHYPAQLNRGEDHAEAPVSDRELVGSSIGGS